MRRDIVDKQKSNARPKPAPDAVAANGLNATVPAMSAAEAAAAIAESIAAERESASSPGEELEAIVRDGRMQYLPKRRRV